MSYVIEGLDPAPFAPLFAAEPGDLAACRARRLVADSAGGFPCRVSLEDARPGEDILLVHHVSHAVEGPFRAGHAIYVRAGAERAGPVRDHVPAMLDRRTLSLRGFDGEGMLKGAVLAGPGEADGAIRDLFAEPGIAYIHAHNAAYGCFLAEVNRTTGERSA